MEGSRLLRFCCSFGAYNHHNLRLVVFLLLFRVPCRAGPVLWALTVPSLCVEKTVFQSTIYDNLCVRGLLNHISPTATLQ